MSGEQSTICNTVHITMSLLGLTNCPCHNIAKADFSVTKTNNAVQMPYFSISCSVDLEVRIICV